MNSVPPAVLLVEKNLFFVASLRPRLEALGYAVRAETAADRIVAAASQASAVCINLSGWGLEAMDLIRRLRADPSTRDIRILGYGSHADAQTFEQARQAGCNLVAPNSAMHARLPELLTQLIPR